MIEALSGVGIVFQTYIHYICVCAVYLKNFYAVLCWGVGTLWMRRILLNTDSTIIHAKSNIQTDNQKDARAVIFFRSWENFQFAYVCESTRFIYIMPQRSIWMLYIERICVCFSNRNVPFVLVKYLNTCNIL